MIRRNVERLEIVEVIFDLRPRGHLEARLHEDALDAQPRTRHRVQAPRLLPAPGQRHIDGAPRNLGAQCLLLEERTASLQGRLDGDLGIVDRLARRGTLGRRKLPQGFELLGEQPLLTQKPDAYFFQSTAIVSRLHVREGMRNERREDVCSGH